MRKTNALTILILLCSELVNAQDAATKPAIDAAGAQAPAVARTPKVRRAPDVQAKRVELPRTRPIAPVSGPVDAGSFQPAGYVDPAPPGLTAGSVWAEVPEGYASVLELSSADAEALRIRLTGPFAEDLELHVYDPVTGSAFGPYSFAHVRDHEEWWTTIIFGDRIGLEFFTPLPDNQQLPPLPTINGIAYVSDVPGGAAVAGGCTHRDVSCEADWIAESNAVAMLSVINAGGNVVGFCSGALLNRAPADFCPVVLTANHCLGNQASANSTSYVWLFRTPSCNGAAPNPNNLPRSDGSLLLKRHTSSDWNLVGLYEAQGGGFFLGWDSNFWDNGSSAIGIHHPGGTFKRISFGSKTGQQNQLFCDSNGQNCFNADVWNTDYTTGFTQPGSSGSPVMDSSARVRGTLTGGPSNDCTISRYGRFDLAFTNLQYYLFNPATPMYVSGAVSGDSGNNGNSERGTVANPFNTVYEATFAVRANDTLFIGADSYNERFTLRRPMTLARWGSSGIVRIGAP